MCRKSQSPRPKGLRKTLQGGAPQLCLLVNPMNTIDISTINHRIQLFINQLVFLKPDSRPLNWWSFPKNGFPRRLKPVHHPPEATQKETPQGSTLNQGIRKMKIWTPNLFVNPKLCPSQVPSYLKSPITIFLGKSPFSLEKSRFSLEKSDFPWRSLHVLWDAPTSPWASGPTKPSSLHTTWASTAPKPSLHTWGAHKRPGARPGEGLEFVSWLKS